MLFMVKNNYAFNINPQLSRIWIKTGDTRMPLKSVWFDESKLHTDPVQSSVAASESEAQDPTEDHLAFSA